MRNERKAITGALSINTAYFVNIGIACIVVKKGLNIMSK
jgi:hypothetical protein